MLKKIAFWFAAVITAGKFAGLSIMLSNDIERLPVVVYVVCGVVVLLGVILICKRIIRPIKQRDLLVYYGVLAVAALFNLFFMRLSTRIEAVFLDFVVIGTFLDTMLGIAWIAALLRERKYIRVQMHR